MPRRGPEAGDLRNYYDFFGEIGSVQFLFLPLFANSLTGAGRVTPSLPQRGKQPKGSIPLTPPFVGVLINLSKISLYWGCPSGGGGCTIYWSSQERLLVSL
jgi:hypothetical protein